MSLPEARAQGWFLLGLAGLLLALSLDELVGLHERLGALGAVVGSGSGPHFAWVLPGALLAAAMIVGLLVGGRSLPRDVRRRLLLAAAVYFAGALVAEAVSGEVLVADGHRAAYLLVTAVEEFLEMVGVVLVLRAVSTAVRAERRGDGWVLRPVLRVQR